MLFGCMDSELTFSFVADVGPNMEEIKPWVDDKGNVFVFLPSYVQLSQLQVKSNYALCLGDITLEKGNSCKDLQLNYQYPFENGGYLTFMRSADIPAMYIDTASGSMEKLHKGKRGTKDTGNLRLYSSDGCLDYSGGLASMKLRGNATFSAEKKAYSIRLEQEGNLLNMGAAEKWILLANAYDATNI